MKHFTFAKSLSIIIAFLSFSCSNQMNNRDQELEKPFPKGERITNDNFAGTAWLHQMVMADSSSQIQIGSVTFEPLARTRWHSHPGGQILLVTEGTGFYQEKGNSKRIIKKGDVIKCQPGLPHWHGAGKDGELVHIAITNMHKGSVVWLEHVSDLEYNN